MRSKKNALYFKCDACDGVGKVAGASCRDCGGAGYIWTEKGTLLVEEDTAKFIDLMRS